MGASEGTRFPLMQPFSTRCLLRFHGHAIRGQCLFFPGFKGHGNAIGPIMCRLCPIYHRTSDSFQPRFGATTKKREFPSPPPRYAHAFFIFRIVGLAMQKAWTIYFNGCGIKRAGTSAVDDDRVAVEKQTS